MSKDQVVQRPHLDIKKLALEEDGEEPLLLRNNTAAAIAEIPAYKALQGLQAEYKRGDLAKLLPPEYWELIKGIGAPNMNGDPHLEATKAAVTMLVCNMVRRGLNIETAALYKAEIAENTWMRAFSKLKNGK